MKKNWAGLAPPDSSSSVLSSLFLLFRPQSRGTAINHQLRRRPISHSWVHRRVRSLVMAVGVSSNLLGPVVLSFRALSGRFKFTVRRHTFNQGFFSFEDARPHAWSMCAPCVCPVFSQHMAAETCEWGTALGRSLTRRASHGGGRGSGDTAPCRTSRETLPFSSSYTKVYSVIYDSGSAPRRAIFSPRETAPEVNRSDFTIRGHTAPEWWRGYNPLKAWI